MNNDVENELLIYKADDLVRRVPDLDIIPSLYFKVKRRTNGNLLPMIVGAMPKLYTLFRQAEMNRQIVRPVAVSAIEKNPAVRRAGAFAAELDASLKFVGMPVLWHRYDAGLGVCWGFHLMRNKDGACGLCLNAPEAVLDLPFRSTKRPTCSGQQSLAEVVVKQVVAHWSADVLSTGDD